MSARKTIAGLVILFLIFGGVVAIANAQTTIGPGKPRLVFPSVRPSARPLPTLPTDVGPWIPGQVTPQRLRELERKYSTDSGAAIRRLQQQHAQQLKELRQRVAQNMKICQEKIAAYRKLRAQALVGLEQQFKEDRKECVLEELRREDFETAASFSAARRAAQSALSQCRRDVEQKIKRARETFYMETRMKVVEMQKACKLENDKPLPSPTPVNVQGAMVEDDEVPADMSVFTD